MVRHKKKWIIRWLFWKSYHIADSDISTVSEEHEWTLVNGFLEPLWKEGFFFPPEIVDILVKIFEAEDEEEVDADIDGAVGLD